MHHMCHVALILPMLNFGLHLSASWVQRGLYIIYHRCPDVCRYTYIIEEIGSPTWLPAGASGTQAAPRPFVTAYAKPTDTALAVKPQTYILDLQVRHMRLS